MEEKRRTLVPITAKTLQLPLPAEVQLHSFLTSARFWGQLNAADTLPSTENCVTFCIGGWVGPRVGRGVQWTRKWIVPTGTRNPDL